jgi:hypothetical protein
VTDHLLRRDFQNQNHGGDEEEGPRNLGGAQLFFEDPDRTHYQDDQAGCHETWDQGRSQPHLGKEEQGGSQAHVDDESGQPEGVSHQPGEEILPTSGDPVDHLFLQQHSYVMGYT